MNTVRRLYFRFWRGTALGASLTVIAYLLYFHRLGDLLPGFSSTELKTYATASSWHGIIHNPVNAPYKLLVWLCTAVLHRSIFIDRVIAAGVGVLTALLFYVVVRAWCSYRVAFFATVMFATSSGLLHFARVGTGGILQMSVLPLLAVVLWYRKQKSYRTLIGYLLVALFVMLWYVPGMIWFEVLGLVPLRGTIRSQFRRLSSLHLAGVLALFLLMLAPLVFASIGNPGLLLVLVGLPQDLSTLTHAASNVLQLVFGIVLYSNGDPLFWVGHAPLLSAVEVVAGLLGAHYALRRGAPARSTFLFGSVAVGIVLASLGGGVTFACLVPILYLFIAIGLDHLLDRWFRVFPRNPIARVTGIGVMCTLVAFSVLYQVRTYYVAWPHAPATKAAFSHPAP